MNKIYQIVWNVARGCYVVASEIARAHRGKKTLKAGLLAAFALTAAGGAVAHAAVTVADTTKYGSTVVETAISGGTKYDITNQQVSTDGTKALNRFQDFSLNQADIANLNLGQVNHQINVVNNKINIDGVVNALKDGKIGGDVYFFSNKGIAVGATGVINVGRLTLGTNARAGEVLFDGGYTAAVGNQIDRSGFFNLPLADRAAKLKDSSYWGGSAAESGAKISIAGQINAKESILISSEKDIEITGDALLRTGCIFSDPDNSLPLTDAQYRDKFVNFTGVQQATGAVETEEGILLYGDNVTVDVQGDFYATGIDANRKAELSAKGLMLVDTLRAGTDAIAEAEGTLTIIAGSAKKNLTLTSAKGNVAGQTLAAEEGAATITAGNGVTITQSLTSKQDSMVKANGDEMSIESVQAGGKVDLYAKGPLTVMTLEAGTEAKAEAEGSVAVVAGNAKTDLILTSTKGNVTGKTLAAEEGAATITAGNGVTITQSLTSQQDSTVKANGAEMNIESVQAGGKVDLYAKGPLTVMTLEAGTEAKAEAEGSVAVVAGNAKTDLILTSTKGNVTGKTLAAEEGAATITAGNGVTITQSLTSKQDSIVKANGDEMNIESVQAGGKVDLYAKGSVTVMTLEAGTEAKAEAEGSVAVVAGNAKTDLILTSTKGNVTGKTLAAEEGAATITAGNGVTITQSLTSKQDSMVKANGAEMNIGSVQAGGKVDLYAKGPLTVMTLEAGTEAKAEAEGSVTIVAGSAKTDLTLTSIQGNVAGQTLEAEEGAATITAGNGVTITQSLTSGQDSIVKANGDEMYIESIQTGGRVDLYAKGPMLVVRNLTAGTDAIAEAEGSIAITNGSAKKDLTLTTTEGYVAGKTFTAEEGTATITAGNEINIIESLTSGQDSIVSANGGDLTAHLIDAGRMAVLSAKGKVDVETLKVGFDGEVTVEGDITLGNTTVAKDLTLNSTGGSIEGTALEATGGKMTITAAKDVTIKESLKSSADMEVKANDGSVEVELVEAGGKADLYAKDDVYVTTANAADDLTITTSEGSITADTVTSTSGKTKLRSAKGTMNVTTLTAATDAEIKSEGDVFITTGKVGDHLTITSDNGSIEGTTFEATKGKATLTAAKDVKITEILKSETDAEIKALGGELTAKSIKANESATLYSQGFMDIENLEATKGNATLTTDDSMDVTNAQIGDVLTMKAAKNITVSQSNSVNKTIMEAGDTIQTKGEDANISSDEIDMTAGESILITDRSPVEKFTGVDLGEAASVTTGSGDAGSLLNGEATGHDYDVTKKGSATLTARKGKADLTAKRLEVDTAIIGTEGTASPATLTMEVDNVAIDDLQSAADTLHVMIHGNTSENTHYAGLHNSTDGSAIVKDSHIDHLNFTGNNDIGTENSTFAGDSLIQTEKVLVSLWKNPGNTTAESIGKIFIHDYEIASSEYFTRTRNGLTVNGERFPYTADSVMNKSLFGDNYLGKDGREKEEENTFYARELRFGEVTDKEAYRVVE